MGIVGQPPFCDEDPMGIYQKILAGKIYFPKYFDKNAKALVKKLNTADLSKRFGNLKDGANDILQHKWFEPLVFEKLEKYETPAPYMRTMSLITRTFPTQPIFPLLCPRRKILSSTGRH